MVIGIRTIEFRTMELSEFNSPFLALRDEFHRSVGLNQRCDGEEEAVEQRKATVREICPVWFENSTIAFVEDAGSEEQTFALKFVHVEDHRDEKGEGEYEGDEIDEGRYDLGVSDLRHRSGYVLRSDSLTDDRRSRLES